MTTRKQFFTQKQRIRNYQTIEIFHPTKGVQRFVSGRNDPLTLGIEESAPRNAGQSVAFAGGAFSYQLPDQNDSYVKADITLARVGKQIKQQLKQIRGADRALTGEVILREYLAGQLNAPLYVLRLFIGTISLTKDGAVIRVEQDNPADRQVSEIYTSERFPGLAEAI